jgi:hypothetical protein
MLPIIWLNEPAQLAQLIVAHDVDAVREVAVPHALGAHEQLVDAAGDRARQRQPHDQRDELDDQEQERDHAEDEKDRPAERRRPDLNPTARPRACRRACASHRCRRSRAMHDAAVPALGVEDGDAPSEQREALPAPSPVRPVSSSARPSRRRGSPDRP